MCPKGLFVLIHCFHLRANTGCAVHVYTFQSHATDDHDCAAGCTSPPALQKSTVGKMGLKGVPGLNLSGSKPEQNRQRPAQQNGSAQQSYGQNQGQQARGHSTQTNGAGRGGRRGAGQGGRGSGGRGGGGQQDRSYTGGQQLDW